MGETASAAAFEKTYRDYLAQVNAMTPEAQATAESILGVVRTGGGFLIPFFKRQYRLTPDGVFDEYGRTAIFSVSVALCRYMIMCPGQAIQGGAEWVSYRDFPDAAPFASAFNVNTEQAVARNFSNRLEDLSGATQWLGGYDPGDGLAYDVKTVIHALPRVPLYLLFNDADEEFPAQCRILFQQRAENYLDMECLAILGWLLSDYLMQACGKTHATIL